jgi:hypothetical protein
MKRSMIFVKSPKSMKIKIMRVPYDHKKTNYSRMKTTTTKYFRKQSHWLALALLALVSLVSCDREQTVPGGWVSMKIDFRGMETSASEDLRSASSETISSQRIVLPSGDALQVDLSIDPESPLRSSTLTTGSYIRLLAIDNSGNLVRYVDWQQGATVPDLYIPAGTTCRFICYSYNNSTNTLPSGYTPGSSLNPLSVSDGTNELLLWKQTSAATINSSGTISSVVLTPQLTKVKLTLDCSGDGKTITGVSNNTIFLTFNCGGSEYSLTNGALTTQSLSSTLYFTWPSSTFGGTTATSNPLTLVPQTGFTLTIPAGVITLSGATQKNEQVEIPFPTGELKAGKIHTISVKLVKTSYARFASSNIYWDGTKLTFDPYSSSPSSTTSPQKQGVVFKWGSLIGLSASHTNSGSYRTLYSDGITIYVPTNLTTNPLTNHTSWTATTVAAAAQSAWPSSFGTDYIGIPYVTDYTGPNADRKNNYLTTTYHSSTSTAAYKGDICQYINSAYRMPRSEEFPGDDSSAPNWWSSPADIPASEQSPPNEIPHTNINGQSLISVPHGVTLTTATTGIDGLFFPASGFRGTNGSMTYVGTYGFYWSSSASYDSDAYYLYFRQGFLFPDNRTYRYTSMSVRCVLQ